MQYVHRIANKHKEGIVKTINKHIMLDLILISKQRRESFVTIVEK
jgi:hypothetical protein